MSIMLQILALMTLPLGGLEQPVAASQPSEPYSMVYSIASPQEVMMIDLNSIERTGDVAEAWSLVMLADPLTLPGAPGPAAMYWMRSRLDCAARTGQFVRAIGMEVQEAKFSVQMTFAPTPLASDWPIDEEFICQGREGAKVAATTLAEASAAASRIMNGQGAEATAAPASAPTPTPASPD